LRIKIKELEVRRSDQTPLHRSGNEVPSLVFASEVLLQQFINAVEIEALTAFPCEEETPLR